jgi:hypothetical protein
MHVAQRLSKRKFTVENNPFGILYNPMSIAQSLEILTSNRAFTEADLFEHQSLWHSFAHHGAFSAPTVAESLNLINQRLTIASNQLSKTKVLLITLGTAFVWQERTTQKVVANCHKLPATHFTRRLCTVEEMERALGQVLITYQKKYPDLHCLISVSPVRHLRDGMVNNQLSKASLLLVAHTLTKKLPNVYYFPAYEMLMDDLRDYRFYEADMLHPNGVAVDYVWDYFQRHYLSEETQVKMQAIEQVLKAVAHRPLYPNSTAQQQFQTKTVQQIEKLEQKYPDLSFEEEKELLHKK